ncbi:MAG TPA: hypothetical protein VF581_01850 [Flavobacterium sp.]|jgi:hypothetical protein
MRNRQILISVAVGVAALTAAGMIMARRNKSKQQASGSAENYGDSFKSKLHNIQRKAQKDYRNAASSGGDLAGMAKDRANHAISRAGANL